MAKIFIGTPAYDGKVHVEYLTSLVETQNLLMSKGHEVQIVIPSNGALLVATRNMLLEVFWNSGCDYMLCIDSDLGWQPEAVLHLLESDKDIAGGVYPARNNNKFFLFEPDTDSRGAIITCHNTHLLKMKLIPAGFMLIKRSAVAKLRDTYKHLWYEAGQGTQDSMGHLSCHAIFNTEVIDGRFWGEDFLFCKRAGDAGLEVWISPFIEFNHAGTRGKLINILTQETEKCLN